MHLTVNGQSQPFIGIKAFRAAHDLPQTFGVALFEPKDFTGLAAIDEAGTDMNDLRQGLLASAPQALTVSDLLMTIDTLQATFRAGMLAINESVGLKAVEIEFAVAGFGDVLRHWAYAFIRARSAQTALPPFARIYGEWLDSTVRLSQRVHDYAHAGQAWRVQIVNHAYGRAGLRVEIGSEVTYVLDGEYACPAEGYMTTLLTEVTARLGAALAPA